MYKGSTLLPEKKSRNIHVQRELPTSRGKTKKHPCTKGVAYFQRINQETSMYKGSSLLPEEKPRKIHVQRD
jgi:hypothetical protein